MQADQPQLFEVAALVRRVTAIAIGERQLPLARRVDRAHPPSLHAGELLRLLADAQSHEWTLDRLIDEVTVKETYFFRNPAELGQIRCRPHLRVWNPARSSGDESYTLAIMEADALRTACGARPKLVGDEGRGA